jgi:hypothetical protein
MKKPPIPPNEPKNSGGAQAPAEETDNKSSKTESLQGTTTVDENLRFEVDALAHVSASKIARSIAQRVKDAVRPSADKRALLIFLNDGLIQALEFYRTFFVQVRLLIRSFDGALEAAADGLKPLAAAPKIPIVAGVEKEPMLKIAVAPAAAIASVTGVVSAGLNLLALFRRDVAYHGRAVEISEPALVVEIARFVHDIPGLSLYWPALGLGPDLIPALDDPPAFLKKIEEASHARDRATSKIHELSVAIGELSKNDPKIRAAQFALDRAHDLFDSADSVLRQLSTSLAEAKDTGIVPVQLLQRAHDVQARVEKAQSEQVDVYFLYAPIESAGGSFRIRRSLFRTMFTGDGLSVSGGSIVSFALLKKDGEIVASAGIRHREDYVEFDEASKTIRREVTPARKR